MTRIYLDNASTSWPKPPQMVEAISDFYNRSGSSAGRSTYSEADDVRRRVEMARKSVANLLGAQTDEVVFTFNGTDSLNTVIFGIVRRGDHVVTTEIEHNSVLRPLERLRKSHDVSVSVAGCDKTGTIDLEQLEALVKDDTRLVIASHASNVTGAIQPVEEISQVCRKHNCLFLLDAAQTVGHLEIDVGTMGCDFLAASGHKGLMGPLGTGVLVINREMQGGLDSFRYGGTGSNSDQPVQPNTMPDKFESGNLNVGGILGLAASIQYLDHVGVEAIRLKVESLTGQLVEGLSNIDDVVLHAARLPSNRVSVVSITVGRQDARELASMLDSSWNIQTRAGFHCAPLIHETLNSVQNGGTCRFSPGYFNTETEIRRTIEAVAEIAVNV